MILGTFNKSVGSPAGYALYNIVTKQTKETR